MAKNCPSTVATQPSEKRGYRAFEKSYQPVRPRVSQSQQSDQKRPAELMQAGITGLISNGKRWAPTKPEGRSAWPVEYLSSLGLGKFGGNNGVSAKIRGGIWPEVVTESTIGDVTLDWNVAHGPDMAPNSR